MQSLKHQLWYELHVRFQVLERQDIWVQHQVRKNTVSPIQDWIGVQVRDRIWHQMHEIS